MLTSINRLRSTSLNLNSRQFILTLSNRYASTTTTTIPSSIEPPKNTLVVLGGGLSGLASAYYFIKALSPIVKQQTKIIILEKQDRTGGWCHSVPKLLAVTGANKDNSIVAGEKDIKKETLDSIEKSSSKSLVFETGPRSIRPVGLQGWLTVEMAHTIGLTPLILTVAKTAPSAKNRYIYYPDSLTLLPSSLGGALKAIFTTPLIRSVIPGVLSEPFRRRSKLHKQSDGGDESVDAFFSRRFGKKLAGNMISAMIHGIYSGDTRKLGVRAIFPGLWEAEREWRSVILFALFGGVWRKYIGKVSEYQLKRKEEEVQTIEVKDRIKSMEGGTSLIESMEVASVWGVKGGLEKLTDTLRDWLKNEGVEFRMGQDGTLESVLKNGSNWSIKTPTSTLEATHLITTLPSLLPSTLAPPTIPSTTVSVLNLAFPPTSPPIFPPGFGYLIPRTVKMTKNPHRALGVIFDSDVMPYVDDMKGSAVSDATSDVDLQGAKESKIVEDDKLIKISILSGGSYWLPSNYGPPSPLPTHEQLVERGLITLNVHFPRANFPPPVHTLSHTHKDCIAQCPPYHFNEMRLLGNRLREAGNVGVVGGEGVSGVGVNGAVKGAWEVGTSFGKSLNKEGKSEKVKTGTEMWE